MELFGPNALRILFLICGLCAAINTGNLRTLQGSIKPALLCGRSASLTHFPPKGTLKSAVRLQARAEPALLTSAAVVPEACGVNATDCTTCTANSSCGWCVSLDKCIEGNSTGPANGGCLVWNYRTCPGI